MSTKNTLLLASGVLTGMLITAIFFIDTANFCGGGEFNDCEKIVDDIMANLLPVVPLFLFSLVTYLLPENVFRSWLRFACVWIPSSMFLILISPSWGSGMIPIDKGTVAFVASALFVVISSITVVVSYIKYRASRAQVKKA